VSEGDIVFNPIVIISLVATLLSIIIAVLNISNMIKKQKEDTRQKLQTAYDMISIKIENVEKELIGIKVKAEQFDEMRKDYYRKNGGQNK
jgi:F0F1-type ATP synthase membrane subunit a